jgi:hypothetical protein
VITSDSPDRPYSTRLRTALVLTGTGTAGAYHAGVLRALHEAGVRIDLVAGRGIGAVGAMFAAVDGGQRLWEPAGLWKQASIAQAYRWRAPLRVVGWALVTAAGLLAVPLALSAVGVVAALIAVLLSLLTLSNASTAVSTAYSRSIDALFAPSMLPTIIPGLIVFCLLVAIAALAAGLALDGWRAPARRRVRHGAIWRLLGAPLTSAVVLNRSIAELWNLIRGAAAIAPPARQDLGRRYIELLAENLGQPGFRELLLVAHDMDARRDVLFAILRDEYRQRFFSHAARSTDGGRAAEAFDLAGVGREHVIDALAASLCVPIATDPHLLRFPAEGPWRGETHRLCDRPGALDRILEEVQIAGPGRSSSCRRRAAGTAARTERGARGPARPGRRAAILVRSRGPARFPGARDGPLRRSLPRPPRAQPARPPRLRGRLRRAIRSAVLPRRTGRSRLRGRLPPVHRTGRRRERRAHRNGPILIGGRVRRRRAANCEPLTANCELLLCVHPLKSSTAAPASTATPIR